MTVLIKARPTTYKGVRMRSRYEAGFAAWLDRRRFEWHYEPRAFASEAGQYLPDFYIPGIKVTTDRDARTSYIEIKPPGADLARVARQMIIILDEDPKHQCFVTGCFDRTDEIHMLREDSDGLYWQRCYWVPGFDGPMIAPVMLYPDRPWAGRYWEVQA